MTDSATIMAKTLARVKPRVFNTPISLTRSRTDIAMVLAETSKIVKTTAPQMLSKNSFTLPNIDTKLKAKARSDSVLV